LANDTASSSGTRLDWVDLAKGISIILVVMMHSAFGVGEATGEIGALHWVIAWANPFRMPEFFLISGLFLAAVIGRDWVRYADRRVVHYLYFYLVWAVIHIAFKFALGAYGAGQAAGYLAFALVEPYGVLWFIYMLAVVSAAAKLLHTLKVPHWAALALGAALQIAPIHSGIYVLDQFCEFFVYFYAGYALAPAIFRLTEWAAARPLAAIAALAAWAAVNTLIVFTPGFAVLPTETHAGIASLPGVHLVAAVAGSFALCVLSALLAKVPAFDWLRWLGARSIVVYLAFALPMAVGRELLIRLGVIDDTSVLSITVLVIAIVSPLILEQLIRITGFGKFLFQRPAWAHIPGTPGARSPAPARVPAE
jgi:uncharacterized membrane protein YcfT